MPEDPRPFFKNSSGFCARLKIDPILGMAHHLIARSERTKRAEIGGRIRRFFRRRSFGMSVM